MGVCGGRFSPFQEGPHKALCMSLSTPLCMYVVLLLKICRKNNELPSSFRTNVLERTIEANSGEILVVRERTFERTTNPPKHCFSGSNPTMVPDRVVVVVVEGEVENFGKNVDRPSRNEEKKKCQ